MTIAGKILMVDLTERKIEIEPTSSYAKDYIGGVGIATKILYDEVPPEAEGIDPENMLTINTGALTGTLLGNKANVMVKSPLYTNKFMAMAGFGGQFPSEMKFAGYDHIVVKGKSETPVYLNINNDKVEICDASHVWGMDIYKTQTILKKDINDPDAQVVCIGPGGENLVAYAMLCHDIQNTASKGGYGAVMGSKNLKAIVVRGYNGLKVSDYDTFKKIWDDYYRDIFRQGMASMGAKLLQKEGQARHMHVYYPDNDEFPWGYYDSWEIPEKHKTLRIEDFLEKHLVGAIGCAFCPIQCAENYAVPGVANGGANCVTYNSFRYLLKSHDMKLWWRALQMCQAYGLENNSTASIISWLMKLYEQGIITKEDTDGVEMVWGSEKAIITAVEKIAKQEGFGKLLRDGIMPAAEKIGRDSDEWVVQNRNLDPWPGGPPYRATMGAYTAPAAQEIWIHPPVADGDAVPDWYGLEVGLPGEEVKAIQEGIVGDFAEKTTGRRDSWREDNYDHFADYAIASENAITSQDISGHCDFLSHRAPHFGADWGVEETATAITAATGMQVSHEKLLNVIQKRRLIELAYYEMCKNAFDEEETISFRYIRPRPDGLWKGKGVELEKLDYVREKYYELRGCDPDTGIPKRSVLEKLDLKEVADRLDLEDDDPSEDSDQKEDVLVEADFKPESKIAV